MIRPVAGTAFALALTACGSEARFEQNNAAITAELANISQATPGGADGNQDVVIDDQAVGREMRRAPAVPPRP